MEILGEDERFKVSVAARGRTLGHVSTKSHMTTVFAYRACHSEPAVISQYLVDGGGGLIRLRLQPQKTVSAQSLW